MGLSVLWNTVLVEELMAEQTRNEELYDKAMEAITKLFGDRSVSKEVTKNNLNDLIGEIMIMLDTL